MKILATAVIEHGVTTNRVRVRKPRSQRPRREPIAGEQVTICISLGRSELEILDARCDAEQVERSTLLRRFIRKGAP